MTEQKKLPQQGITREQAFELATETERSILEILMQSASPIATNRWRLQMAREIAALSQPAADERVKEIRERWNTNSPPFGLEICREDVRYLLSLLPVQPAQQEDDGWVTFGRIKTDIESETETFERIPVQPAASTLTECPNCGNSYADGAICGPTHALIANQHKQRTCVRCGHNNVDRHGECRQCIDWQRHKCVFEGAVDTAASTEAQDVTNTGDENAERWRGTMTDRDTTVTTTPPDFTEHPYYAHVRNCEHCSGPHGHCAEGLKLKNADANLFTEQARQLVQEELSPHELPDGQIVINRLIAAFASFAAEAATQGQMVGIERAHSKCIEYANEMERLQEEVPSVDKQSWTRFEHFKQSALQVAGVIRALSPDPSYLNRVRNEAATAALEQAAQMLAKGSDGVGGDWEAAEAAAAITKPIAIGDDKG